MILWNACMEFYVISKHPKYCVLYMPMIPQTILSCNVTDLNSLIHFFLSPDSTPTKISATAHQYSATVNRSYPSDCMMNAVWTILKYIAPSAKTSTIHRPTCASKTVNQDWGGSIRPMEQPSGQPLHIFSS